MKRLTSLFSVFAGLWLLAGCGQSGPLYLPGDPSTMATPPAATSAGDEEADTPADETRPEGSE